MPRIACLIMLLRALVVGAILLMLFGCAALLHRGGRRLLVLGAGVLGRLLLPLHVGAGFGTLRRFALARLVLLNALLLSVVFFAVGRGLRINQPGCQHQADCRGG